MSEWIDALGTKLDSKSPDGICGDNIVSIYSLTLHAGYIFPICLQTTQGNYTKLKLCARILLPYLPNFPCIIVIELEVIIHFPNKHNTYFPKSITFSK